MKHYLIHNPSTKMVWNGRRHVPHRVPPIVHTFNSIEEAQEYATRLDGKVLIVEGR